MVRLITAIAAVLAVSTVALAVRVVVDATTYSALSQQATSCVAQEQRESSALQAFADNAKAIQEAGHRHVPNDL